MTSNHSDIVEVPLGGIPELICSYNGISVPDRVKWMYESKQLRSQDDTHFTIIMILLQH